jgi:ribosome maturation factor RimP
LRQAAGNSKGVGKTGKTGKAGIGTGGTRSTRAAEGRFVPDRRPPPAPRPVATGPKLGWREAIDATVTGLGFDLVDVERAQRGLLRVTIDRIPGRAYTLSSEFVLVEDCEQVTRQLQYALEVEGLDYARLEVSSPGLDRPLKSEGDFERFSGQAVRITLKLPFEGRKVWEGMLGRAVVADAGGPSEPGWQLVFKTGRTEQVLGFRFEEVREARLVPVVDFKGRKPAAQPAVTEPQGQAPAATEATEAALALDTDGGLENR